MTIIDFETANLCQAATIEGVTPTIVPAPTRSGNYAMQVSLPKTHSRSEITAPRLSAYGRAKIEWSIFVPLEFKWKNLDWGTIVTQLHDWGTGGPEYTAEPGPPTSLVIGGGSHVEVPHWEWKLQFQSGSRKKDLFFDLGEVNRGVWTDFILDINLQQPWKGGFCYIWVDGVKKLNYKGTTWYKNKARGPYFKAGMYRGISGWNGSDKDMDSTLYFDQIKIEQIPEEG